MSGKGHAGQATHTVISLTRNHAPVLDNFAIFPVPCVQDYNTAYWKVYMFLSSWNSRGEGYERSE